MEIPKSKEERLDFIGEKYEAALDANAPHIERFARQFGQYNGSKKIDGTMRDAKVVRNITREDIEGQIDTRIPFAKVSSQHIDLTHTLNARAIERLCAYYAKKLGFVEINDKGERQTYVFGGSVWLAEFDSSIIISERVGMSTVRLLHPRFFTPQPGVENIDDMDYIFIDIPLPREEIERRYNIVLDDNEGDAAQGDEGYLEEYASSEEMVLLHICYYKDENRNVCQYIWTDDVEILHISDYYARKVRWCETCGRRAELCEEDPCDSPKYYEVSAEEETIERDILDKDGNVIIPAMTQEYKDGVPQFETKVVPMTDELGRPIVQNVGGVMIPMTREEQVPKLVPTKLPFYKPKSFPVVVRLNTSAIDGDWCGVSDCDVIRDQQQTVNKYESRALEKSMKSGVVVAIPDGATVNDVDNSVYDRVVRLKPNQSANQFGSINTEVNIGQDISQSERHYESAKKLIGISNSYLGQADTTAKSGRAKQVQIQQAAGRLESKRVMKKIAFAKLFRIIFELELAYRDETVPLCDEDEFGGACTIHFSRYAFYKFNPQSGKWFIDADYLFETDYDETPEEQRETMWELNMANFEKGMFGDPTRSETKLRYWIKQEKARFPYAYEEVAYCRRLVQAEREAMKAQAEREAMRQMQGQNIGQGGM